MADVPENVRQVLVQLLPATVVKEISSYVFYDNHPRDTKNIDIIVFTKMGEVKEYFQRDLISSVYVQSNCEPSQITIFRNAQCDLFYLIKVGDILSILSRKDRLEIHHTLENVTSYDIKDTACTGYPLLYVRQEHQDLPMVADNDLKHFIPLELDEPFYKPVVSNELAEMEPIIMHLKRKLKRAIFTAKCNEKIVKEFLNLRHSVAFANYKRAHPNLDDTVFKEPSKLIAHALKINMKEPWIQSCNKKILIIHSACNQNEESIKDLNVFLHCANNKTIEYVTKIFEKSNTTWCETKLPTLKPNKEYALVTIIELEEIKNNILSRLEFNGVIIFKKAEKEFVLPMSDIKLSSLHTMGDQFDVLTDLTDNNLMLAVIARSTKTNLILRHIKLSSENSDDKTMNIELFSKYLDMELLPKTDNVVIHRKSPYHVLYGLMVIVNKAQPMSLAVTVYSRSSSQVLALIHLINDTVPYTIVTTTPAYKTEAKNDSLSPCDNSTVGDGYNYTEYASSILNRTSMLLEYLDNCMIHMSESQNNEIRNLVGTKIHLVAQGEEKYNEFKLKMLEEEKRGVRILKEKGDYVFDEVCKADE